MRHSSQCFLWQVGHIGASFDLLLPWLPVLHCGFDEFPLDDPELCLFELCPLLIVPPDLFLLVSRYWALSFNDLSTIIALWRTSWWVGNYSTSTLFWILNLSPTSNFLTLQYSVDTIWGAYWHNSINFTFVLHYDHLSLLQIHKLHHFLVSNYF